MTGKAQRSGIQRARCRAGAQVGQARYAARGRGLSDELTRQEWLATLEWFGFTCAYCGVSCEDRDLALDHYIPLTRGGPTTRANCIPACRACNSQKLGQDPLTDHFWGYRWDPAAKDRIEAFLSEVGGPMREPFTPVHATVDLLSLQSRCGAPGPGTNNVGAVTCDECRTILRDEAVAEVERNFKEFKS